MGDWAAPDYVALHAAGQGARIACVDLATGRSWTYAALDRSIGGCAAALAARGVGPGARVAMLARNSGWQLIAQLALARLGAVFVPLNWRLTPAELEPLVADCEPQLLIADAACAAMVETSLPRLALSQLADEADAARPMRGLPPPDADAPSILLYTSGTSGRAKGVIVTERNAFFTASNFGVLGEVGKASVFLCDSPMFHVIGLLASIRPALMQGGTLLISEGFDPDLTYRRLADPTLGVSHYFCVPQMAQRLREASGFEAARLARLTAIFTGGAPNPAEDILAWLDAGVRLADGYGMTEAGTVLGMPPVAEVIAVKAGAAGLPAPTLSLRLAAGDGQEAATGEVGEIQLKGPNVTPGYWRRPDETAAAFTADGWLRTGDLARRDADGFVTLVDRRKDMFISGGENVYPAEVEQVLLRHPAVVEAAVVGIADPRWGEVGCAFVVTAGDASGLAETLAQFCVGQLARYKVPKAFRFVAGLPRTGSGKVRKQELRDAVAS